MILNRYERMIAKRYLLPGKSEGFIFVVAGFSVGAVALGVAALIIGPRGLAAGTVELKNRRTGIKEELSIDDALARLTA